MIGTQDVMVGLVLALFFFGAKKLPELAGSIGKSMKEFKKGMAGDTGEDESAKPATPAAVTAGAASACASCQIALQPDWTHCPGCGAVVAGTGPGPRVAA
jgi:TatA/E family protein of Tat protein translocase